MTRDQNIAGVNRGPKGGPAITRALSLQSVSRPVSWRGVPEAFALSLLLSLALGLPLTGP